MKIVPQFMFMQIAESKSKSDLQFDNNKVMNRKNCSAGWFNER